MFIDCELQNAIEKVQKIKKFVFDKYLTRMFIGKVSEFKEKMPFGAALRCALNHLGIGDKEVRNAYASLAGTYFGKHGGRKAAQNKKYGSKNKTRQIKSYARRTLINKKGQHEFDF